MYLNWTPEWYLYEIINIPIFMEKLPNIFESTNQGTKEIKGAQQLRILIWDFPGSPAGIPSYCCRGLGSIPGWGT